MKRAHKEKQYDFANGHCHNFAIALCRSDPSTYTKMGAFLASGYAGEDPDAEILIHAFAMTADGLCEDVRGKHASIEEMWESLQIDVEAYDYVNENGEEFDSESDLMASIGPCGATLNEEAIVSATNIIDGI